MVWKLNMSGSKCRSLQITILKYLITLNLKYSATKVVYVDVDDYLIQNTKKKGIGLFIK